MLHVLNKIDFFMEQYSITTSITKYAQLKIYLTKYNKTPPIHNSVDSNFHGRKGSGKMNGW